MSSRRSLLLVFVIGVAAITWAASRFSRQVSGRAESDAGRKTRTARSANKGAG